MAAVGSRSRRPHAHSGCIVGAAAGFADAGGGAGQDARCNGPRCRAKSRALESWREERVRRDLPARVAASEEPPALSGFYFVKRRRVHTAHPRMSHLSAYALGCAANLPRTRADATRFRASWRSGKARRSNQPTAAAAAANLAPRWIREVKGFGDGESCGQTRGTGWRVLRGSRSVGRAREPAPSPFCTRRLPKKSAMEGAGRGVARGRGGHL